MRYLTSTIITLSVLVSGLAFATPAFAQSVKPDGTNRPHRISSNVLQFTDGNGVAQQVTLKPLPALGIKVWHRRQWCSE